MQEVSGDLWEYPAQARCIPTNLMTVETKRGRQKQFRAVMGAGVAQAAVTRYPDVDLTLGRLIHEGMRTGVICTIEDEALVAFPTKTHWALPSTLALLAESAQALVTLADRQQWTTVVLPRVGCGFGRLAWEVVRPVLATYLDDRFVIVTPEAV